MGVVFVIIVSIFDLAGYNSVSVSRSVILCPGIQFWLPCTHKDNFLGVPNCSLGPSECETKLS